MHKYLAIFKLSCLYSLRNYKALIGLSIFLITCLIIFANLWKIIGSTLNPSRLLWYIAFNEWIIVSIPDIQETIAQDLRTARLSYLLPRPLSYLGATFAEAAGVLLINLLILGSVTFIFAWWQTGMLPFDPLAFIIAFFLGCLAGLLAIIFNMIVGLSAFWLHDVSPCYWIWEKLLFMFGGLMLPLTSYPIWMQSIAALTPFPLILGARSALTLDFNLHHVFFLTISLIGWGIISTSLLTVIYRKGLKIIDV